MIYSNTYNCGQGYNYPDASLTTGLYEKYKLVNSLDLRCERGVCNSCNIGTSDLPDMYVARGLRAYISGKSRVPMLQLLCNIALW